MNEPTKGHETSPRAKIAGKLARVIEAVQTVPETGYNSFHKYNYVTEADLVREVRNGLAEQGVCFSPSIVWHERSLNSDERTVNFRCLVEYTFVDSESGESLTAGPFWGEGEDKGDKAGYKAMTGALKYCLRQTFLVPTGEDPERDEKGSKSSSKSKKKSDPAEPAADWNHENRRFRALTDTHPKRAPEAMRRMIKVSSMKDVQAHVLKDFNDKLSKVSDDEREEKVEAWCVKQGVEPGYGEDTESDELAGYTESFTDDDIPF